MKESHVLAIKAAMDYLVEKRPGRYEILFNGEPRLYDKKDKVVWNVKGIRE